MISLLMRTVVTKIKYRRCFSSLSGITDLESNEIDVEFEDELEKDYQQLAASCFPAASTVHNCFIIHPYIKWGPQKVRDTNPQKQIKEAESLIRTLEPWTVHDKIQVSLETLDKKNLFGTGNLEKLKKQIRSDPQITAVFVNKSMLKNVQIENLERHFGVPVLDRYKIVMQILRLHATTKHAKLQVALAEIPYIKTRIFRPDSPIISKNMERRKDMLQTREQKLKQAIQKLRFQREVFRKRRKSLEFPVVAVVGYTNCGKTCLIKTLTGEKKLEPRNQLFATLDVTMHAGILPSKMEVLYVDTVGFISNIPTDLIECFVATLEDALYGDVILHIEDLSSEDREHQHNHVIATLESLSKKAGAENLLDKMITVGNKIDLINHQKIPEEILLGVSAKTQLGIDVLREMLDKHILKNTDRVKITIKVPSGGDEMRWLYKNSTVISTKEDTTDVQFQKLNTVITNAKLAQFKHLFLKR